MYSKEFQKLLDEELKEQDKNIIVNLIKNHVKIEVITEVFGVEEQYIYNIVVLSIVLRKFFLVQ